VKLDRFLSFGNHIHNFSIPATLGEFYKTVLSGKQGIVIAPADIGPGMEFGSPLADDNPAGKDSLSVAYFDSETLGMGVTTVPRTADTFFMGHS
jgi:hypothetical protein